MNERRHGNEPRWNASSIASNTISCRSGASFLINRLPFDTSIAAIQCRRKYIANMTFPAPPLEGFIVIVQH
jgi:hypothetical protein